MPNYSVYSNSPSDLKALIYGAYQGNPIGLTSDANGILNVKAINVNGEQQSLPMTAFKELRVAMLTPVAGWSFNYNVNTDLVKTATSGTGSITQSNSKAVLQTGTSGNSSASVETIDVLRYTPGMGALARFTAVFTTGVAGCTQTIGIGDATDGFFFGYNGLSFGVLRRQNGVDNWIYRNNWNGDKFDGTGSSGITLDTTKGNVYSIRFQWLGFGVAEFMIENPKTGEPIIVHRIEYSNSDTVPSIYNPTLPITAKISNTTNTTNMSLQTASAMAFVEGNPSQAVTVRNSISSIKSNISSEQAILTIRNKSSFQSKTNRIRVRIDFLSVSADGTKVVRFRLIRNTTLGGTPAFADISANTSVVDYDTAGTTVTGGRNLLNFESGKTESNQLFLDSLNLILAPGDTITVAVSSSNATEASVSISWRELF